MHWQSVSNIILAGPVCEQTVGLRGACPFTLFMEGRMGRSAKDCLASATMALYAALLDYSKALWWIKPTTPAPNPLGRALPACICRGSGKGDLLLGQQASSSWCLCNVKRANLKKRCSSMSLTSVQLEKVPDGILAHCCRWEHFNACVGCFEAWLACRSPRSDWMQQFMASWKAE